MLGMLIMQAFIWGYDFRDTVVAAAVVMGIVPAGLFVMITLTYSMASLRLTKQNALIQQVNAVESLSNVDVFCMDKTGTLTSNSLELREISPITGSESTARTVLGVIAHSATARNKTTEALAEAIPGETFKLLDEVPFSSATKWSAVSATAGPTQGVFAMGAPEFLGPLLATAPGDPPQAWLDEGLRVLLAASSSQAVSLHDAGGAPVLPRDIEPLCWIAIADKLRPNSQETIRGFQEAGIEVKIISGDNPETVSALAKQAGLSGDFRLVSGTELAAMSPAEFDAAAIGGTVFGRITPAQKAELVDSLQRVGKYVAMTGDGVNDVMSLKKANLGIAMESGSQATRAVADIVLLKDTFAALPASFIEGQRVRRGLQSVFSLFLTRVFVVVIALLLISVVGVGFPFSPANMTLLTVLTVGFPTFFMALWAHPGPPARSLVRSLVAFVLPAAVTIAVAAFAVYTVFYLLDDVTLTELRTAESTLSVMGQGVARDALTYLLVLTGVMLVPLACPPNRWWAVIERTDHDYRPTLVAVLMVVFYIVIIEVGFLRDFFGTHKMSLLQYIIVGAVAVGWLFLLRYVYQTHIFERFFGMDLIDDDDYDPLNRNPARATAIAETLPAD
jgi:cation-transporting ATPase E